MTLRSHDAYRVGHRGGKVVYLIRWPSGVHTHGWLVHYRPRRGFRPIRAVDRLAATRLLLRGVRV